MFVILSLIAVEMTILAGGRGASFCGLWVTVYVGGDGGILMTALERDI